MNIIALFTNAFKIFMSLLVNTVIYMAFIKYSFYCMLYLVTIVSL